MNKQLTDMRHEMLDVLENNILRFWQERMVDTVNGGFYGRMAGNDALVPEAEKGAVLKCTYSVDLLRRLPPVAETRLPGNGHPRQACHH